MQVNEFFNITGTEYVDIPLDSDVELYVDPNRIKLIDSDIFDSTTAKAKIDSYFLSIFEHYEEGKKHVAIDLLETPKEINATHLGMSKERAQGNGPSREILSRFFENVTEDGRLTKAVLSRPVLIPLFVTNFGPDRFSDLIVNIISKELAVFTKNVCDKYGVDTKKTNEYTYYNIQTGQWEQLEADLPQGPDGNPILLVPDALTTDKYGFSAEKYVYQIILVYLQNEHLEKGSPLVTYKSVKGTMTPVKPSKKMLYNIEIKESDETGKVKAFALKKSLENPHLLEQYINFVEGRTYLLKKDTSD